MHQPEVREAAMEGLASLYRALVDKWGLTVEWTKEHIKNYAWIPNKLFSLFSCLFQPEDRYTTLHVALTDRGVGIVSRR